MPDFIMTQVDGRQVISTSKSILDNDIRGLLFIQAEIERNVMSQLDSCWEGVAKEAFVRNFILYSVGLANLIDGYQEIMEQMYKAGEIYEEADDGVRKLIKELQK